MVTKNKKRKYVQTTNADNVEKLFKLYDQYMIDGIRFHEELRKSFYRNKSIIRKGSS